MKKLLTAAFISLSLGVVAQQGIPLKFTKGQKLEIVTESNKVTTMEVMGQSMETKATTTITESFDVEDVSEKGATIEYKVKRLVVNSEGMGRTQSFDSEKEGDRDGEMGKVLEKSLKNKYTMVVDKNGTIVSVKADDDNPNATKRSAEDEAVSAFIGAQLGIEMNLPAEGSASIFKILPAKNIAVGESWVDTSSKEGYTTTRRYKVAGLTDAEIVLDYNEESEIKTSQEMMGAEATVKGTEKASGNIVFDRSTGIFKSKTITKETEVTMEAQGMAIPTTDKTTIKVTVK